MPKVAIIVLNYNGRDCLPGCLSSLGSLSYLDKEVIVVDNGSSDDSLMAAKENFPECSFIENGENLGFAAGMNRGIRSALEHGTDFVWLFNYDASSAPDTLDKIIRVAEAHPEAGLLSPVISDHDGKIW
jgi:GT2 family glycosyltransferase